MDIASIIQQQIENPYDKPTDIIGFSATSKNIANSLLTIINPKEICFFDEDIKADPNFHYLDFSNMLAKTEIMIFTKELTGKYNQFFSKINPSAPIVVPKPFQTTLAILKQSHPHEKIIIIDDFAA